ncbi:TaqI-like C-terminal specificity domain-containing protein [Lactococcus garvieae]|uniref:TaqI-like C-terminal specificity domain-containing protein n=1 Tax=Lactococcus garvieae TaxID=1363 RepID=UPI003851B740
MRPILRGKDIKRYGYTFANLYVITAFFGIHKIMKKEYPAIYSHLKMYEEKLKARGQSRYTSSKKINTKADYPGQHHWLELDNNPSLEYMDDFNKQKIVFSRISGNEPCFSLDNQQYMINDTGYMITGDNLEYLLEKLCSPIYWFAFKRFYMGGGIEKEFKVNNLANLPIPKFGFQELELTEEEMKFISFSVNE